MFRNLVGAYAMANHWGIMQRKNDLVDAIKVSGCQPGAQVYIDVVLADSREKKMLNSKMMEYLVDQLVYNIVSMPH